MSPQEASRANCPQGVPGAVMCCTHHTPRAAREESAAPESTVTLTGDHTLVPTLMFLGEQEQMSLNTTHQHLGCPETALTFLRTTSPPNGLTPSWQYLKLRLPSISLQKMTRNRPPTSQLGHSPVGRSHFVFYIGGRPFSSSLPELEFGKWGHGVEERNEEIPGLGSILTLPLPSCVALGRSGSLSEPLLSH